MDSDSKLIDSRKIKKINRDVKHHFVVGKDSFTREQLNMVIDNWVYWLYVKKDQGGKDNETVELKLILD